MATVLSFLSSTFPPLFFLFVFRAGQLELGVAGGKIALNIDTNFAFSDGLAAGEHEALSAGIGPALMARVVRVPLLAMARQLRHYIAPV